MNREGDILADITGLHQSTVQNLKDAGCDEEFIVRFANDIEADKKKAVNLLGRHRAALLDDLHGCNKKIDCLDYLIRKIEKLP
jgi:hypothetical protein